MVKRVRDAYSELLEREETEQGPKIESWSKIRDFCGVMDEVRKCGWCVVEWQSTVLVEKRRAFGAADKYVVL